MPDASTTHLVVNTGAGSPELIGDFGAGDRLGLVGFFASDGGGADLVRQSFVPDPGGAPSLQLEVYEAGAATPAATVLLVGVAHALGADALFHW